VQPALLVVMTFALQRSRLLRLPAGPLWTSS
jgi:hypothetical protein